MAIKEKACLNCKAIYMDDKCPKCGETPSSDSFKGRLHVFNAEKSEVANKVPPSNVIVFEPVVLPN